MVLPDSHGVARAPWYSGARPQSQFGFAYGGVTRSATPFQTLPLPHWFLTPRCSCRSNRLVLQPPSSNACRLTLDRFGLVPVRSPLLGESRLISFPPGTEMVQFPGFALCSPAFPGLGFPIRTSPCQRSLASSTGLIAGSCVLHRLLVPRHPPCALNHLTQILDFTDDRTRCGDLGPRSRRDRLPPLLCECERATTGPSEDDLAVSQRLVAVSVFTVLPVRDASGFWPVRHAQRPGTTSEEACRFSGKEVIQPQVPLRLPCYDFTPIIKQTVGACVPYGFAQRLQVHPTFVV